MPRAVFNYIALFAVIITIGSAFYKTAAEEQTMNNLTQENPLLNEWTGNYGGVPAFDQVKVEFFQPALEAGMDQGLAEIERIAGNSAAPDFSNTIAELERSGKTLDRITTVFYIWASNMNSPEFAAVLREMSPKLAAFSDKINQNERLFQRIETVYKNRDKSHLDAEQKRLVEKYYRDFVRSGAKLGPEQKTRLSEINQKLAALFNQFSQNLLNDEEKFLALEREDDLAGLPQSLKDGFAADAATRKAAAKWIIANTRSSVDPFLTYSERRDLREKVWKMFIKRGDNGDENDNNGTIPEILQLRYERAKMLGYETHAHFRLEVAMAKTPENAMKLMEDVWKPAVARVHEEVADMQALANKEGANITIEPWDYRFYMEKVRKEKYDLDQNEVKPYLQLDNLREGMFYVAGELFGFSFTPINNVPVYHPDVKVWDVKNRQTGQHIGLGILILTPDRENVRAWMNAYRSQQNMDGAVTTIVSNNSNFVKGKEASRF